MVQNESGLNLNRGAAGIEVFNHWMFCGILNHVVYDNFITEALFETELLYFLVMYGIILAQPFQ